MEDYNKWKVLQVFLKDPKSKGNGFQLRELSRLVKLASVSVSNYLNELIKEGLVLKEKTKPNNYPIYSANWLNKKFKTLKVLSTIYLLKYVNLKKLKKQSFIEYIESKCMPNAIILFGSGAKGEDVKGSDLDIFVQANEKNLKELSLFEELLNRKINLFFKSNFSLLSNELKNNILNGVMLKGYLKVF